MDRDWACGQFASERNLLGADWSGKAFELDNEDPGGLRVHRRRCAPADEHGVVAVTPSPPGG